MKYILFILLLLTACSSNQIKSDQFVFIKPDRIDQLNLTSPEWVVYNQSQLNQIVLPKDELLYTLTDQEFKLLMSNLIKISDKLKKQDKIINYYDDSITNYELKQKVKFDNQNK